ncbi:MAG: TlpA disulfide reductase family protein [Calditrichota bacterium]
MITFTRRRSLISLFIGIFAFLTGCRVEEYPNASARPQGVLSIRAEDSTGAEILSASIILDGTRRFERTPAILLVDEGLHQIVLRKLGFVNDTTEVEALVGDTVGVEGRLIATPLNQVGWLELDSQPGGAKILEDGQRIVVSGNMAVTPARFELAWGEYQFSAHLPGHALISPLQPLTTVFAGETTRVSFNLSPLEIAQQVGKLPFDFTLENVDGDSVTLSDLTGNVVLINFWYADCVPCMNEFPGLQAVYQAHAAEGFYILAINPMFPDDLEEVERVRDALGLTFQLLLDWNRDVTITLYHVNPFPRNILVDRGGVICAIRQSVEREELDELVIAYLNP